MGARTTTAPTPTGAEQNQARNGLEGAAHRFAPLWPLILGLAFGRAGLIVASYGSYTSTDEGIFTDGAMLVALVVLALFLVFIVLSKRTISKHVTNVIMRTCVALEAFVLMALAVFDLFGIGDEIERFALSSLCTLVSSGAIYYWLRRARGTSTTTAAVFVSPTQANDYFGFSKTMLQSKQFLTATALGIGCLSIVIGLLRGYPDGTSIAFTPATRIAYAALTIGVSVALIVLVLKWRERVMTVGIFVIMELLACFALIAYAGFPDMLDIGAVFTTTLNALMVGFTWYVIIAFMSYGWRDPYYYAIAGWLVWLGCRAVARIALLAAHELFSNDMLMSAAMGTMVVLSTQVVFVQFLNITRRNAEEQEEQSARRQSMLKIMGLDEHESLADMRQASMKHNAEEMGKQFLLSDREIEVMALYALGYTQKRVAEELFITQGTAHAHIKRIYAKTGLHSRQEILDYLEQYAS